MAITNAQQYQQLVNKPANGKRPGYRGPGGYQSGQSDPSTGASGNIGGGGAPGPGDTGGEGGNNPTDNSTSQFGGGADNTGSYDSGAAEKQKAKEKAAEQRRKEKAAADKKTAEAKAKEEKKEARAKVKRDKKTKQMQKAAFDRFQKLEKYVDLMDDYGASGEDLAKATGFKGDIESGFEYDKDFFRDSKTGKIKDQFTKMVDINKGKTDIFGNPKEPKFVEQIRSDAIPGYDFSINPVNTNFDGGLGTLTSYPGGVRPNDYGLQMSKPPGFLGLAADVVRPETGLQAFNTLEEARNVQDFAGRFQDGDDSAYEEFEDYVSRNIPTSTGGGGGGGQQQDPCLGPNPPAYCNVNNDDEEDATPTRNLGGLAPRFAGSIFDFTGLANGGRAGAMDGGRMMNDDDPTGGIMDLESGRQMYFLGKLVKKASRAIKKVVKSPIGKAALMYFGGQALSGAGGSGIFSGLKKGLIGTLSGGEENIFKGGKFSGLANFLRDQYTSDGGKLKFGLGLGLGVPFALDALGVGKEEEDTSAYDKYRKEMGLDINKYRYGNYLAPNFTGYGKADGGRIGYAEGSEEPVAKETMPLIDMDGKEMDLREDGGFVPLGRMERADDVPARLSKNEFVFTADAVRNAGEGDIDKGAEVMYNMMKNLESGGDVSEESQGLEGAREMFQTSQRLEEVI